jgi:hypothetical protein
VLWAQKAKINWDINGDRNTRYFQAVVKKRRRSNRIIQIKNDNDQWVTDPTDIEHCFQQYFHKLYEQPRNEPQDIVAQLTTLSLPTLSDFQAAQLNLPISDEEIVLVVNQLGPLKTPGPDGIPATFYQKFWSTVRIDIINMVKAFFHSGFMLKSLNHTFITLIPKVPNPEKVTQFRPIALCNVTYKIISKILVNRLKPFMDSLIIPFQNAFIQGR